MKPKSFTALLFAFALASVNFFATFQSYGQGSVAAITAYTPLTTVYQNFTGTRGSQFIYLGSSSAIVITELGVYDVGGNGLVNAHQIGLWSADGSLLGSATVPAGTLAPLMDGYRHVAINPVVIPYRSEAIVAAAYAADDADDLLRPFSGGYGHGLIPSHPAGGYAMGFYGLGTGLPFPNLHTPPPMQGQFWPGFLEANFRFTTVPEPSSAWLFILGSGVASWLMRLKSRRRHRSMSLP